MNTELAMFIATIIVLPIAAFILTAVMPSVDKAALRAGLWINGIDGKRADEIIKWKLEKDKK